MVNTTCKAVRNAFGFYVGKYIGYFCLKQNVLVGFMLFREMLILKVCETLCHKVVV